jgi:hypothetical protein
MLKKMAQNNKVSSKKRNFRSFLTVMFLIAALVGVVYAMRYVRGSQFQQGLAIIFGPAAEESRMWTWCPKDTGRIEFYTKRASEDSITPEQICEITLEPVSVENANRDFKRYLTVGSGETSKTLEADEKLEVFRVDGLVFQSQILSTALKGH